jgi:hypothetical protein
MLEKKKPLAMFVDEVSALPDEDIVPESKFRPYVENGSIIRKEFEEPGEYVPALCSKRRRMADTSNAVIASTIH